MSKKHKAPKIRQNTAPPASAGNGQAQQAVPPLLDGQTAAVTPDCRGPLAPPAAEPSMKKYLFVFWTAVALAVAAAWTLEHFMPLTHEYIIERWIMLAFGAFLAVFLFFLK